MNGLCQKCYTSNVELNPTSNPPTCLMCLNLYLPSTQSIIMTSTEAVILLNRLIGEESDLKKLQIYDFIKAELMKVPKTKPRKKS